MGFLSTFSAQSSPFTCRPCHRNGRCREDGNASRIFNKRWMPPSSLTTINNDININNNYSSEKQETRNKKQETRTRTRTTTTTTTRTRTRTRTTTTTTTATTTTTTTTTTNMTTMVSTICLNVKWRPLKRNHGGMNVLKRHELFSHQKS